MTTRRVSRRGRSNPSLSVRRRVAWLIALGATVTVCAAEPSIAELTAVRDALNLVTEARELLAEPDHRRSCLRRSTFG